MIQNIMHFITVKAHANCEECLEGLPMDSSHDCLRLRANFHERSHLLYYFDEVMSMVMNMMKMKSYLNDIQQYIYICLLRNGYSKEEIQPINLLDNIVEVIESHDSIHWCFDQLWRSHPVPIIQLSVQNRCHSNDFQPYMLDWQPRERSTTLYQ